jgi:hypothetical protein
LKDVNGVKSCIQRLDNSNVKVPVLLRLTYRLNTTSFEIPIDCVYVCKLTN